MWRNYIQIAFRKLLRQKGYAFINIFGMAVGLSVFFMIGLYVFHELSYDRFIPDAEQVVRVVQKSDPGYMAATPPGLAPALKRELPGIETMTVLQYPSRQLISVGKDYTYLSGMIWTDQNFLDVFPFEVLHGSGSEVLEQPGKIILTQSTANMLFGTSEPIGRTVQLQSMMSENEMEFDVAGIVADPPANFHFSFNALLSFPESLRQFHLGDSIQWRYSGGYIYTRLTEGTTMETLQQQLTHFEEQRKKPDDLLGKNHLTIQALTDIHLARDVSNEIAPPGNRTYIVLFSLVGLLILGIAGFNYMNLSVAQAVTRSKEVGIRKVSGASRRALVIQFLGESFLLSLLSLPLALVLLETLYPVVTRILGVKLDYTVTDYPHLVLVAIGLTAVVGLISGSYPAFVLSSMKPAVILKNWGGEIHKGGFRTVLVTMQFAISIVLLTCTFIFWQQMHYVQQKQLGFESENVLTFTSGYLKDQYPVFKHELLRSPRIASVSSGPPIGIGHKNMMMPIKDIATGEKQWLSILNTDYDYIKLMGMNILSGRDFSPERPTDAGSVVVVNESAVKLLGLGRDHLRKTIKAAGTDKEIIGVVQDFHNESLYSEIGPVVFQLNPEHNWTGLIKLTAGNLAEGVKEIEAIWNRLLPDRPFEFTFLDDRIEAMYQHEKRLATLFTWFSIIAIIIAGLGLIGLAAFISATRTKEIGVRKVLGASVAGIVSLLSKDFLKLVLIGFVIAVPIAWYAMDRWLEDFAYRIDIGPGVFVLAGLSAVLIALATVSFQSIKTALMNPVDSLRNE